MWERREELPDATWLTIRVENSKSFAIELVLNFNIVFFLHLDE